MIPTFFIFQITLNIALSAVVSGLIYLGIRRFLPYEAPAIALFLGFLTGYFTISGLGGYAFPPKTVQNWLPHIAIVSLALGILEKFWFKQIIIRWVVRVILLELFLWRIFQPFINHPFPSRSWTGSQTFLNLLGTSLVIVLFWWGLDYLLTRAQNAKPDSSKSHALLPTGLMLIGAGSSLSVVLAHSLIMGQLSGTLTATLGALAVLAWITAKQPLTASVSPLICLLYTLPWLSIYTTLPKPTVLVLALSPVVLIPLFKGRSLMQQTLFRLGLVALVVSISLLTAWQLS
ncbi:MAG: hypothetical protein KC422_00615 [Trueperaceae bacterium]|nr:hypothetical protein [Trueperaceae bacterium]